MAVSKAIAIHHEIEGLVSALASELFRVVDFDVIGMSRFEEVSNRVDWHLHRPGGGARAGNGAKEETICDVSADAGLFLDQEKRLNHKITGLIESEIRSLCAFPLFCGQKRIGCLLIGSKQPEPYSNDEVRFLSLIADMIASALAGALNSQALQKTQADLQGEKDRLQLLLELNNQVVSNGAWSSGLCFALSRRAYAALCNVMSSECICQRRRVANCSFMPSIS